MYKPERMYQINRSDQAVIAYKRFAANYIDGSLIRAILFYITITGIICTFAGLSTFVLGEKTGYFVLLFLFYYWFKSANIKNKLMDFKGYTYKR